MTAEPASTCANRINSDSLDWSYIGISFAVEHSASAQRARGRSTAHSPSTPNGWPQLSSATPAWSICDARASACVSTYSRMLVSLPSRTVMAKIQSSSNGLFLALALPPAEPTPRTRSPAREDPLDLVGDQRRHSLPVAAKGRGEEVLHGLDVLLGAHRNLSISLELDRVRSGRVRRIVTVGEVVFISRT